MNYMSEKLEFGSGLTLRMIIFMIIMVPLAYIINFGLCSVSPYFYSTGLIPPDPFVLILILEVLLYINPKWRLSPHEYTTMIVICGVLGGPLWLSYGQIEHNFGSGYGNTISYLAFPVYAYVTEPFKTQIFKFMPSYWYPSEENAILAFWGGFRAPINWPAWTIPIIWWGLWYFVSIMFAHFWSFFLRKQLIDIERLPFPGALPSALLIQYAVERKPGTHVSALFDFQNRSTKLFWFGFLVGFAVTFTELLNYVLPAFPPAREWTTYMLSIPTQTFLPGAYGGIVFIPPRIPVYMLMPLDSLITALVCYIGINVLYPAIGVATNILPYTPGTPENDYGFYGMQNGPFKYVYFGYYLYIGIGLWLVFRNLEHFKEVFTAAFKFLGVKPSGEIEEEGVPYSILGIGSILLLLIMIGLLVANAVPPIVAVFMIAIFIFNQYGCVALASVMPRHTGAWFGTTRDFWWDVGVATGQWSGTTPTLDASLVNTMLMGWTIGDGYHRISPLSMQQTMPLYKVANVNRTRARDVLIVLIVTTAIMASFGAIWNVYWVNTMGGFTGSRALRVPGGWSGIVSQSQYYTLSIPFEGKIVGERWALLVASIIFTAVCYTLRARFAWFFFDPAAASFAIIFPNWIWFNAVLAFLAKYIILKVAGSERWEKLAVPWIVGWSAGYGVNFFILALTAGLWRALPEFSARL